MPISDTLKNDIRVRERLLRKNLLTDSEVERQDAALLDVEDKAVVLELKQPALQKESERAIDGPRISRPAPAARPAPIRPFEEEDDDDYGNEKLSKSERRRLKKLSRRDSTRRAA